MGEALLHVQIPDGNGPITVSNGSKAIHRVAKDIVLW